MRNGCSKGYRHGFVLYIYIIYPVNAVSWNVFTNVELAEILHSKLNNNKNVCTNIYKWQVKLIAYNMIQNFKIHTVYIVITYKQVTKPWKG